MSFNKVNKTTGGLTQIEDILIDSTPTQGSTNAVQSGGTFSAIKAVSDDVDEVSSQIQTLTSAFVNNVNVNGCKNIAPFPYDRMDITSKSNITVTQYNNGSIYLNGTNNSGNITELPLFKNNDFIKNFAGKTIVATIPNIGNAYAPFIIKDANGTSLSRNDINSSNPYKVIEVPSNAALVDFSIDFYNNSTYSAVTIYPMVCLKSDYDLDSTWQPPTKTNHQLTQDSVTWDNISEVGAVNYAPNNLVTQAVSQANFTLTHNADDSITVYSDGVTSGWSIEVCSITIKAGTYRLKGTGTDDVKFQITDNPVVHALYEAGASDAIMTFATDTAIKLRLSVFNGKSYDNVVVYPMITPPSYNGPFVPHAMTNKELTDDVADIAYEALTDYGSSEYTLTEGKMWQTKGVTFLFVAVKCNTVSPISGGSHIKIAEIPSKFKKPQFNIYPCIANYKDGSTHIGAQLQIGEAGQIAIRGGETGASYAGLFSF